MYSPWDCLQCPVYFYLNAECENHPNDVLSDVYARSRCKLTFIQLSNNKYAKSALWSIVQMHFSGEFRVDEIPCSVLAVM